MFNFFGFFTKKEEQKKIEKYLQEGEKRSKDDKYDYDAIIKITRILTNGNKQAVADMSLFSRDHELFKKRYSQWYEDMIEDTSDKHDVVSFLLAYWLVGHDRGSFEPSYRYGYYMDWKDATEDIIWGLKEPIERLSYPIDLKEIEFTGKEFTDEVLQKINDFCLSKGYSLVSYDTGSDCYHLFVIKADDFDSLALLGKKMNVTFFNEYV